MIVYRAGDLFSTDCPIIVHGCNAQGVMGSGVARVVKQKYPTAYADYRAAYDEAGLVLGKVYWSEQPSDDGKIIGNAITQVGYGRSGVHVDYAAITDVFTEVRNFVLSHDWDIDDGPLVAIPKIGAGLGGGDWGKISELINNAIDQVGVVCYTL